MKKLTMRALPLAAGLALALMAGYAALQAPSAVAQDLPWDILPPPICNTYYCLSDGNPSTPDSCMGPATTHCVQVTKTIWVFDEDGHLVPTDKVEKTCKEIPCILW